MAIEEALADLQRWHLRALQRVRLAAIEEIIHPEPNPQIWMIGNGYALLDAIEDHLLDVVLSVKIDG